jgi:hypothetical protein
MNININPLEEKKKRQYKKIQKPWGERDIIKLGISVPAITHQQLKEKMTREQKTLTFGLLELIERYIKNEI